MVRIKKRTHQEMVDGLQNPAAFMKDPTMHQQDVKVNKPNDGEEQVGDEWRQ